MEKVLEVELGCTVYASDEAGLYGYTAGTHCLVTSMLDGPYPSAYLQGTGWTKISNLTVVAKAKPFLYVHEAVFRALNNHGLNLTMFTSYGTDSGTIFSLLSNKAFNTTKDSPLTINEDNGELVVGKQAVRIGRLIRALSPNLKDEEVEAYVSKHKTLFIINTNIVQTSDDIGMVYNISRVGGSCMAEVPSKWFDIYTDAGSSIAYILNDDGSLRARGLIHEVVYLSGDKKGKTGFILDRLFYDDEAAKLTLQKWRREQGEEWDRIMYCGDVRSVGTIQNNYEGVPYIDNLYYASNIDGELYLTNQSHIGRKYDYMQETRGGSSDGNISHGGEDYVWCEDVEESYHIDDTYWVDNVNGYYRYDDDLRMINDCWIDVVNGEDYYEARDDEEYHHVDDLYYDKYNDGYYYDTAEIVEISNGEYGGEWIHKDNAVYCDDLDDYVSDEDMVYHIVSGETYFDRDGVFEHTDGKLYLHEEEVEEA